MTITERLLKFAVKSGIDFTAAAFAALGLGVLHLDVAFGTRFTGSLFLVFATELAVLNSSSQ